MSVSEEQDQAEPLSVGAAAARLGVAPATLRSWERRYGLSARDRSYGGHRRYSQADLGRLIHMQQLVGSGLTPARAARQALLADPDSLTSGNLADLPDVSDRGRGGPGGRVLAVPGGNGEVRGLARAVSRLDGDAASGLIGDILVRRGLMATWDDVLRPVLMAAGLHWMRTGSGVDIEHVLAESSVEAFRAYRAFLPRPAPGRPVLLACSPEDQHSLPLHALATALAERQIPTRLLGARVPAETLATACRRTGAGAVFIWRQLVDPDGKIDELEQLPRSRMGTTVVLGGPGWIGVTLPKWAQHASDLPTALRLATGPRSPR